MFASTNEQWCATVVPNLPPKHRKEYMEQLANYAPQAQKQPITPQLTYNPSWCFPFFDIPDDFNHEEFETWTIMVEQEMMDKHKLTQYHFEC